MLSHRLTVVLSVLAASVAGAGVIYVAVVWVTDPLARCLVTAAGCMFFGVASAVRAGAKDVRQRRCVR